MKVPPSRILLATDLSARSDRAQDRAVSFMKQYDSELLVLHILESTKQNRTAHCARVRFSAAFNPDDKMIASASWKVRESLGTVGDRVTVRIEKGVSHRVILKVAMEERCDLIVIGVARNEMLGRITLGKTVDHLIYNSEIPLLIVTDRVRTVYQNIVITSDFSDISREAIETAATFFPDRKLKVLHAHGAPGSWAVDDTESYREQMRRWAYEEFTKFLDTADLPENARARISALIEWGNVSTLLQELIQCSAIDLVVVGSQVRNVFLRALIGSNAQRIVSALSCDALVVRSHRFSKGAGSNAASVDKGGV